MGAAFKSLTHTHDNILVILEVTWNKCNALNSDHSNKIKMALSYPLS